ncbi:G-box-binding factor 1 [Linum grandiflorum]
MGTGEENTPPKPSKPAASSTPEVPTTPAYPEWPGSMQVYYGTGGTPPFFPSSVASPHPYVYQHPMMPHYGTPVPYPAMYPGGVYAHPNMAMTPNSMAPSMEMEAKAANGKDQPSAKKSKGTSASKAGESRKVASGSGNDAVSQSGESGSDGSSDGSDEQQEYTGSKKGSFNQMLADANAQNNTAAPNHQGAFPVVSVPGTNLNIGMDLWNASPAAAAALGTAKMRSGGTSGIVPAAMPEQWGQQDEREVKRQKRKQSNRESARRSRLRKQAECEELQHKVENLNSDNHNLKNELLRLSEECEKLKAENDAIKKKLNESYGQEATDQLEQNDSNRGDEGNS